MQLETSLHRVGSDMVGFYLVADERGVTMVDAGLPGQWGELTAELGTMGRSVDDIRGVILTHGDSDHLGVAERLRRNTGSPSTSTRPTPRSPAVRRARRTHPGERCGSGPRSRSCGTPAGAAG